MTDAPHSNDLSSSTPTGAGVPDKPALEGLEAKWAELWKQQGTYAFDRTKTRDQVFSIDTPPPTVCGSLHVGHVFSYTHTDLVARFQRMAARRSSTRWAGTTTACPPSAGCRTTSACVATRRCPTTRPSSAPEKPDPKKQIPISRQNFIELCETLVVEDEKAFEQLWRHARPVGRLGPDLHDHRP